MSTLKCLYEPLADIEAALDAFASSPDEVRELSLREIAALIEFEQKMRGICDWLRRMIEKTERQEMAELVVGRIDSEDHPVLQKILRRRKEALDRAANIRRQHVREVTEVCQRSCIPTPCNEPRAEGSRFCQKHTVEAKEILAIDANALRSTVFLPGISKRPDECCWCRHLTQKARAVSTSAPAASSIMPRSVVSTTMGAKSDEAAPQFHASWIEQRSEVSEDPGTGQKVCGRILARHTVS
jgi:hypothetical protein